MAHHSVDTVCDYPKSPFQLLNKKQKQAHMGKKTGTGARSGSSLSFVFQPSSGETVPVAVTTECRLTSDN